MLPHSLKRSERLLHAPMLRSHRFNLSRAPRGWSSVEAARTAAVSISSLRQAEPGLCRCRWGAGNHLVVVTGAADATPLITVVINNGSQKCHCIAALSQRSEALANCGY